MIFFFMLPPPPRSSLFPYTTLFRSGHRPLGGLLPGPAGAGERERRPDGPAVGRGDRQARSEEHTSELQSRPHLVCRLLLEKKKGAGSEAATIASARRPARRCPRSFA